MNLQQPAADSQTVAEPFLAAHPDPDRLTADEIRAEIGESEEKLKIAREAGDDELQAWFTQEVRALSAALARREGKPAPSFENGTALVKASKIKPKKLRWLWPGRTPIGKLSILDGDPGLGKSLVSIDIIAALTTGRPMPGCEARALEPAGAVLLSAEDDPEDTLQPRLALARADLDRVVLLQAVQRADGQSLPTIADLEAIAYAVKTIEAKLVVIDPLTAYLPTDTNSHRDQDIRRSLAPLAQLAADLGVAILVIRHLNKTANNNPLYRGGGSIGIIGAARSGLLVAKDPDSEGRFVLSVAKSNLAKPAPSLCYEILSNVEEIPFVNWLGVTQHTAASLLGAQAENPEDRSAQADAEQFLKEYLETEPRKAADVFKAARAAGISEKTLRRAKARLNVKSAQADFHGGWFWRLPEADTQMANSHTDGQNLAS